MPTYEYRCDNGHSFEVVQRMTEDSLSSCQTCDAPAHRVFGPVAVHFKGSGFYSTDYGKGKQEDSGGDGKGSDGNGKKEEKKEGSTETKKSDSTSTTEKKAASSD